MPSHQPITPSRAVELVEARNLKQAQSLLADFAAAGLIKTYALVRHIRPIEGPSLTIRDSQIPPEEWERIISSNNIDEAFNGGTVRLEGSAFKQGTPSVQITGVSFSEASLVKVLERYCARSLAAISEQPTAGLSKPADEDISKPVEPAKAPAKPVPRIRPGDLTASIAQTMQATGLKRTKIDDLMKQNKLVRKKVGRRTLITVESIEKFIGVPFR